MKLKHEMTALMVAGSLASGTALASGAVDIREDPGFTYQKVEPDAPISSNLPGQNLAGVDLIDDPTLTDLIAEIEDLRGRNVAMEQEVQRLAQSNAQLEQQQAMLQDQMQGQMAQGDMSEGMRTQQERLQSQLEMQQSQLEQQQAQLEQSQQRVAELEQTLQERRQQQAQAQRQPRQERQTAQVPPPVTPELVRELQQRLQAEGYSPGPTDGIWGPRTHQALQQYQQQQAGLEANGQLTPETLAALNLEQPVQRAGAGQGQQPQG